MKHFVHEGAVCTFHLTFCSQHCLHTFPLFTNYGKEEEKQEYIPQYTATQPKKKFFCQNQWDNLCTNRFSLSQSKCLQRLAFFPIFAAALVCSVRFPFTFSSNEVKICCPVLCTLLGVSGAFLCAARDDAKRANGLFLRLLL